MTDTQFANTTPEPADSTVAVAERAAALDPDDVFVARMVQGQKDFDTLWEVAEKLKSQGETKWIAVANGVVYIEQTDKALVETLKRNGLPLNATHQMLVSAQGWLRLII